ncbi:PEP-CTERM sorting domain-containing protein [uncultured Paludibaculum sp.]|uniref:PEP-CTERM sorting domain-containing protein n=1 Tax=uncultured Paludibaculum sp. TaxID=1765020 RepID=UPI002AABA738|nr:PEP-CTERM sorting domain-containing protein [uncultured Paludibaculum sp.]
MTTGIRKFLELAVLSALTVGAASAAPILTLDSGTLTVSRLFSSATFTEFPVRDIRGLATLNVLDPILLGTVTVADNTGGTDPNFGTLSFGVSALNGADATLTQLIVLSFDLANAVVTPNSITAQALGTPNGTVTDAALLRLIGSSTWTFGLSALTPIDAETILVQYSLSDVTVDAAAVPEPATTGLILIGGSMVIALRRLRKS